MSELEPANQSMTPRFDIPADSFVRAPLAEARDRLCEVAADMPSFIGATAFGSAVKGYAMRGQSDLDLAMFVAETDAHTIDMYKYGYYDGDASDPRVNAGAYEAASAKVMRAFDGWDEETLGLSLNRASESFLLHPISLASMRESAEAYGEYARLAARYKELRADRLDDPVEKITDWSEMRRLDESFKGSAAHARLQTAMVAADFSAEEALSPFAVDDFLGDFTGEFAELRERVFWSRYDFSLIPVRLFGLAITSRKKLAPYRAAFLEGIQGTSDPRMAWNVFADQWRARENGGKHPRSNVRYPQSAEEALQIYGV